MSFLYTTLSNKERDLIVLALQVMLNNKETCLPDIFDQIFISGNTPRLIKKLKEKEEINSTDLSVLSCGLLYTHNVFSNIELITEEDKEKIEPYKAIFEKLYQSFRFFIQTE